MAISALRSLVHLQRRVVDIRDTGRIDDPLPLLLPALPPNRIRNQLRDPGDMQTAFAHDPVFRAALDARGLLDRFDTFNANIDPDTGAAIDPERLSDMFWSFMGLYYQVRDQQAGAPGSEIGVDQSGLDRFIVRSAEAGGASDGLRILRATAETLVEFLGANAGVFLARSPNKLVLSAALREFASRTDFETDASERILKILVGSLAAAAADHGPRVSESPAAALLISSLGKVRQDLGDDFVARIVSHDGFSAVVSDWVARLAEDPFLTGLLADMKSLDDGTYDPSDPSTLPRNLQPVFTALQATLGVIGDHVGTRDALDAEEPFRAVFEAVLGSLSRNAGSFLRAELDGDQFMSALLQNVITTIGRTDAIRNDDLIAPVFRDLMDELGHRIPEIGQDAALGRAEEILLDLAQRLKSAEVQDTLRDLERHGGGAFGRRLMTDLFATLRARADLAIAGEPQRVQAMAQVLLTQLPALLDAGLDRDATLRVLGQLAAQVVPEDQAQSSVLTGILPAVTGIVDALQSGQPALPPDIVEAAYLGFLNRLQDDRPVLQDLHAKGQAAAILESISAVLGGDKVPSLVSAHLALGLAHDAFTLFTRHGRRLADAAKAAADPDAALRTLTADAFGQAVDAAVAQLGRGAAGPDMPTIARAVLAAALAQDPPGPLSKARLTATLTGALAQLN